jgi:predicted permease
LSGDACCWINAIFTRRSYLDSRSSRLNVRDVYTSRVRTIWRGVRARGWRAIFSVALLTVALAANTVVFSAVDAFVFDRVPYPLASRLVEIATRNPQTGAPGSPFATAGVLDEWARQRDVFASVQGYLHKNVFVTAADTSRVPIADVTPGLFDLLGARPRWGRPFTAADAAQPSPQIVIVSEGFARDHFGSASDAVGRTLATASQPMLIVGVMPGTFAFPNGATPIWRVMDPHGPLTAGFVGVFTIARLADGIPFEAARDLVQSRAAAVGAAAGSRRPYAATLTPLRMATGPETQRRLFLVVLGTAVCLLLSACASVASVELAAAVSRARVYAIRLALGEGRASLIASAMGEGLAIVTVSTLLAMFAAQAGAAVLSVSLPDALRFGTVNVIDVDRRALFYMAAAAVATWLAASLPVVLFAARANVAELLKQGETGATVRGSRLRQVMTVSEVAVSIVLLAGTLLYARTYIALAAVDKGFDTRNLAVVTVSVPMRLYPSNQVKREFAELAIDRLTASREIVSGMWGSPPPDVGGAFTAHLQADDRPAAAEETTVGMMQVQPSYFSTLGIPLRQGRALSDTDDEHAAVISEDLARQLWPGVDPIGHRFRWDRYNAWRHVVGVAARVRNERDPPGVIDATTFQVYTPWPRVLPAPPPDRGAASNDGAYGFISMVVRVDSPARLAAVLRTVREMKPGGEVRAAMLDDEYAEAFQDRLFAATIIGAFGVLAFLLAGAGVYGVMAFLVASRAREIGIRMALGADSAAIRRLVVRSSAGLLAAGLALGSAIALSSSRLVRSQLFGVSPSDPVTWTIVVAAVAVIAVLATWRPTRAATRLDPSTLLRN